MAFLNFGNLTKMAIVNPFPMVPITVQTAQATAPPYHQNSSMVYTEIVVWMCFYSHSFINSDFNKKIFPCKKE